MKVTITRHAQKRLHERCGITKKGMHKFVLNALEKGTLARNCQCRGEDSVVFGQWVFAFEMKQDRATLVTVTHLKPIFSKRELRDFKEQFH